MIGLAVGVLIAVLVILVIICIGYCFKIYVNYFKIYTITREHLKNALELETNLQFAIDNDESKETVQNYAKKIRISILAAEKTLDQME